MTGHRAEIRVADVSAIDLPKVTFPPLNLSEGPGFADVVASLANTHTLAAKAEVEVLLRNIESNATLCVAEIRRDGAYRLVAIETVRRLGFRVDVDKVAAPFEATMRRAEAASIEMFGEFGPFSSEDEEFEEVARDTERRVRSAHARIMGELADAIRLLREASVGGSYSKGGHTAPAFRAYRKALTEVIPGATIEGVRLRVRGDDVTPVLQLKVPSGSSARELVALEMKAHDIVEAEDSKFVGIFAIEYIET